ncbi:hypothetical protein [Sporomusa sp. KB1]|jgi:hypothetical protein|uniref:hypothetical protein n=1 Tax=Sporomusa sp. KB1 TaxID=943346 RepID=UPI0011AA3683|nr:hypothetical protein [Sporomusa sp. KB1]TWH45632.1 hypothetical protein Salpa_1551 [Sporomusa sp. KB1]
MNTYEVKYHLCPTAGDAILMMNTVKTSSPEDAKKMVYSMLYKNKPSNAKVKFMYVRKVANN